MKRVKFTLAMVLIYFSPIVLSIESIEKKISSIIKESGSLPSNIGITVFDLSGRKLYSLNEKERFIPASLSKIFVSIMGATVLRPGYKFRTTLGYSGVIEDGELKGDLYLLGGGDPQFYTSHLNNFICALKQRSISKVTGNFYFVDSSLPYAKVINMDGDLDKTDNPGISALSVNYNRFSYYMGENGFLKEVVDVPSITLRKVDEDIPLARFRGVSENGGQIWKYNRSRVHYLDDLPVRDPSRYTAELFRYLASLQHISIPLPSRKKSIKEVSINKILWHDGHDVIDVIDQMLEYSNNLMAELILLKAAKEYLGKKPPFPAGTVMLGFLKNRFSAVDWSGVYLENGSGHSYKTRVTPVALGKFLQQVHNISFKGIFFGNLFSVSGHNGWVRKRLYKDSLGFRVLAKTGTLDYASSIAGYFFGKSGKKRSFVVMTTDRAKRAILDTLNKQDPKRLALKKEGGIWKVNSINLQDSVIKVLINRF